MFKKLAISGCGIVVALALVSCGGGTGSGGTTTVANVTTTTTAEATTTTVAPETTTTDPKAPFTVGEAKLQLSKVTLGGDVGGTQVAPEGMTGDQTALVIQDERRVPGTRVNTSKLSWGTDSFL